LLYHQSESSNNFFLLFADGLDAAFFTTLGYYSSSSNIFLVCAGFDCSAFGCDFFGNKSASSSSSPKRFLNLVGEDVLGMGEGFEGFATGSYSSSNSPFFFGAETAGFIGPEFGLTDAGEIFDVY